MAMLDLLLSAERDGLIDDEGIKEEVDTFTFEVSVSSTFIYSKFKYRLDTNFFTKGARYNRDGHDFYLVTPGREQGSTGINH